MERAEQPLVTEAQSAEPVSEGKRKRRRRRRSSKKKVTHHRNSVKSGRQQRPFPASSFEEPLEFAKVILAFGSGQPVRRLTLFDHIGKSPESGPSRQLITSAGKYGLVRGGYKADQLALTPDGAKAADDSLSARELARVRAKLAIEDIPAFRDLYEGLVGNKLPAKAALTDSIKQHGVPAEAAEEAIDTFIVNLRFVGLLKTLSGAERIVPIDHLLDGLPAGSLTTAPSSTAGIVVQTSEQEHTDFNKICFYIAPIGLEGSEQRKHSDLFMGSLIEPALEPFGLKVVRADGIDKPGVITRQVIEYILRSKIIIADLSFHNPNVFYELALRHATRLPIVQIIRQCEFVPFDVNQMRTVPIDTSDIYSLVPKLDLYRAEISNQVRRAMENADAVDTPISVYFPAMRISLNDK